MAKAEQQYSDQILEVITELNGYALELRRGKPLHDGETERIQSRLVDLLIDTRRYERDQTAKRSARAVQQSSPA